MAGVDELLMGCVRQARKEHSFEAPVRKIDQFLIGRCFMGEAILEMTPRQKIGSDPAVGTGKQPVGFQ